MKGYIFDKRKMKAWTKKYLLILLICLPFMIMSILFLPDNLPQHVYILIEIGVALVVIITCEVVLHFIKKKKDTQEK